MTKARFGVLAADAEGLAVGPLDPWEHLVERRQAVGLGLRVGRLPRDHGQVVVEALVADPVVLAQQLALARERAREQLGLAALREALVVVLVLEDDQEHVLDRGQVRARRRWKQAGADQHAEKERGAPHGGGR